MKLHLHMQTHGRIRIQLRMYTDVCAPNHTCGPFNIRARTENTSTCVCTHVVGVRLVESRVAGTLCSICVYMHPYMCDLIIFSAVQFFRSRGACYIVFLCFRPRGVTSPLDSFCVIVLSWSAKLVAACGVRGALDVFVSIRMFWITISKPKSGLL